MADQQQDDAQWLRIGAPVRVCGRVIEMRPGDVVAVRLEVSGAAGPVGFYTVPMAREWVTPPPDETQGRRPVPGLPRAI